MQAELQLNIAHHSLCSNHCVQVNSDMLKDTVPNQSKFEFGEEAYKEIHKKAHLKETR